MSLGLALTAHAIAARANITFRADPRACLVTHVETLDEGREYFKLFRDNQHDCANVVRNASPRRHRDSSAARFSAVL
jgi:hypothetical protein